MNRALLTTLIALTVTGTAPAIDLTPSFVTTVVDGIPIRRPCFVDGDKRYAVTVDRETELTGYDGAALFNFKKFPRAVMRLGQSPLKPDNVFSGEALERYRAVAVQLILKGAEEVTLESGAADVLPINHWTSQRFVFAYKFTGAAMRESVTFLNLDPKQQVVVQIRARESDFAIITARGEDIIRRWHMIEPGTEAAGN
jgi:hypothetical protein